MKIINFKKKKKKLLAGNSKNYVKMQKFAIFANKYLKINKLRIKDIVKLGIIFIIQVLHMVYVIKSIVYLRNSYSFSK